MDEKCTRSVFSAVQGLDLPGLVFQYGDETRQNPSLGNETEK